MPDSGYRTNIDIVLSAAGIGDAQQLRDILKAMSDDLDRLKASGASAAPALQTVRASTSAAADAGYEFADHYELADQAARDAAEAAKALAASMDSVASSTTSASTATVTQAVSLAKSVTTYNDAAAAAARLTAEQRRATYGFLQLGRVIDDMQYIGEQGLRPIINNVMEFNPALGMVMVGVELFRKMYGDELSAAMGETIRFGDTIDELKAKIKDLESHPGRVNLDASAVAHAKERLEELQERLSAFHAAIESEEQRDLAGQAKKAVTAFGGGAKELEKIVAGQDQQEGRDKGLRDAAAAAEKALASAPIDVRTGEKIDAERLQANLDAARERLRLKLKQNLEEEIGGFLRGEDEFVQKMQDRARRAPGAFGRVGPGGVTFAEAIGALPPTQAEAMRRADDNEQAKDRERLDEENRRDFEKARREKEKAKEAAKKAEDERAKGVERAEEAADAIDDLTLEGEHKARLKAAKDVVGQAKDARSAAADDIRDSLRDIGLSGDDAGTKQQALRGVAARIQQQAATLGEEAVGDLMRQARAAFQAAARQGDAQLKRDMADDARAMHGAQPTAQIQHAAAPLVQQAVARGVPHGRAQHDIPQEISHGLMQGMDLQHATQAAAGKLAGYVEMLMHQQQQLDMTVNRIGAGVRGNRGGGLPTLQNAVRPGP